MTNIELQELLKQFPPEAPVFGFEGDEIYAENVMYFPKSEHGEEAIYL